MDGRRSGSSLPIKCCSFTTKKTWAVRQYFGILQFFKVSTVMIKLLRFFFFRKFVTIRSTTLMWQRWSRHSSFRCHVIRIDRYRPYGSALHTKGGVTPEMLARSESLHLSAFIPSQTEMGHLFGVRLG